MSETIISNTTIIDPEKEISFSGNIIIKGDRIERIIEGELPAEYRNSPDIIDAKGLAASPGFIDIHTHTDGDVHCGEKLLAQGVTTTISGNCGISPLNLTAFFDEQNQRGYPIHQAEFIGHSFTLRKAAGLLSPHAVANRNQIQTMKGITLAAFDEGACGISFGIQYAPGTTTEEFLALSAVAAGYGRMVSVHARLEFPNDFDSLRETLEVARITGARVLVSHLAYMYADGRMREALNLLDDYRAKGYDVWADSGMYTDFETLAGTTCFDEKHIRDYGWSYSNFLAATGRYAGTYLDEKSFSDIRTNSPKDALICFTGNKEDIYIAAKHKDVMISSDAGANPPGQGHPQGAGNFPKFFRLMVRERKELSLVEAVRKCTLLPATAMNLKHKGRLSAGADADIVLFDPQTIADTADFPGIGNPDSRPVGIPYVFVSGKCAVVQGKRIEGVLAGKAIRY